MHVSLPDIISARIAGLAGYDFIWVDTEHSSVNTETVLADIMAIQAGGTAVIVRVPQDDLTFTKRIAEMGPDGIIFPMVRNAQEADRVLSYTLYPPYGIRGFGPQNAVNYGLRSVRDYVANNHLDMCRFIQIEHIEAVKDLDRIMENEFIDGYIFGPNDLSGSLGVLGNVMGEEVSGIMGSVIEKLHAHGKFVGVSTGSTDCKVLEHWHRMGVDMISAGADYEYLRDGAINNRRNLERIHKQSMQPHSDNNYVTESGDVPDRGHVRQNRTYCKRKEE